MLDEQRTGLPYTHAHSSAIKRLVLHVTRLQLSGYIRGSVAPIVPPHGVVVWTEKSSGCKVKGRLGTELVSSTGSSLANDFLKGKFTQK